MLISVINTVTREMLTSGNKISVFLCTSHICSCNFNNLLRFVGHCTYVNNRVIFINININNRCKAPVNTVFTADFTRYLSSFFNKLFIITGTPCHRFRKKWFSLYTATRPMFNISRNYNRNFCILIYNVRIFFNHFPVRLTKEKRTRANSFCNSFKFLHAFKSSGTNI